MKTTLILTLVTLIAAVDSFAAPQSQKVAVPDAPVSASTNGAALHYAKTGGFIVKPGSQKGKIVIVDMQTKVQLAKSLDSAFHQIKSLMRVRFDFVRSEPKDPSRIKNELNANFAVIIVADETTPSLAVMPHDGFALVNVLKYTGGLNLPADSELYEKRCARAALKAYAYLCSACGSAYTGNVATARTIQELDISHEKLTVDTQTAMRKYLTSAGVTPMIRTVYRRACEQGWAPAPTNAIQKAIWDKVHAIPKNPMKIEFDPKKGR